MPTAVTGSRCGASWSDFGDVVSWAHEAPHKREFDVATRRSFVVDIASFLTAVSVRSWCALRKISLSFCVLLHTLVSIGVPFLMARGA